MGPIGIIGFVPFILDISISVRQFRQRVSSSFLIGTAKAVRELHSLRSEPRYVEPH